MPEYALIFRTTRPVDPAALSARNAAARDWAIALRERGVLRTASPLEEDGRVVRQDGVELVVGGGAIAIASVLVIEAASLDAATSLAEGHPGLAYGTEIEVRPLKSVVLPPSR